MPDRSPNPVFSYLDSIVAAERAFESQLRAFAIEGDDNEVQAMFAEHAEETRLQHERLAARLQELGGASSAGKSALAYIFGLAPRAAQLARIEEERTVQNLIVGYTIETSECAMYEALLTVAGAAGDAHTSSLARQIQSEEARAAEKMWHFIRTRSIIAYNMLTISEIDPAVETKVGEASWTTS